MYNNLSTNESELNMENIEFEISLTRNSDVILGIPEHLFDTSRLKLKLTEDGFTLSDENTALPLTALPDELYQKIVNSRRIYVSFTENQQLELLQVDSN